MDELEQDEAQDFAEMDEGFDIGEDNEEKPEMQPASQENGQENPPYDDNVPVSAQPAPNEQRVEIPESATQPETQRIQDVKRLEKAPDNIAEEWEELKRLNPQAAELALEDSEAGAAIRKRMENYGADIAQDKAEKILEERTSAIEQARAQREAVEAYNRRYVETIKSKNPAYYDLTTNPNRKAEATKYFQDINAWIEGKPYREAGPLLQIARQGNADQVLALIAKYESEKGKKRPDPTGALAVPARGMPGAPSGIGDKDSFDAGWELNKD